MIDYNGGLSARELTRMAKAAAKREKRAKAERKKADAKHARELKEWAAKERQRKLDIECAVKLFLKAGAEVIYRTGHEGELILTLPGHDSLTITAGGGDETTYLQVGDF